MSKLKHLLAVALLAAGLTAAAAQPINVNSADARTLADGIVGIGPARAAAIVQYREAHGPFKTVDDLLLVKGIGQALLDRNRDHLTAAAP